MALLLAAPHALAAVSLEVAPPAPEAPDPHALASGNWADAWIDTDLSADVASGVLALGGGAEAARGFTLRHVDVWVDGRYHGRADGTTSWTYALDTRRLGNGEHEVAAYGLASPADAPSVVRMGWGEAVPFTTGNAQAEDERVVLFEQRLVYSGAQPTTWTYRLPEDLVGLRVRIEADAASGAKAVGSAVMHYLPPSDAADGKVRTWHATYGARPAAAGVSQGPHDALDGGGLLVLKAMHAGEGGLRVVVDALRAHAAPPAQAEADPGAAALHARY